MNRRDFVSRVALGAAGACTSFAKPASASPNAGLKVRFVGMMTFVERTDRSFLVATQGQHSMHHMVHVPLLMARGGTPLANELGLKSVPNVVPAAFDPQLEGTRPDEFVYRNLENTSIEIVAGVSDAVINEASQMAHLHKIAPGKRVRGNLEKWATNTVSMRGGRLENSAAHPDAGKVWRFGSYRQQLTDAVNYVSNDVATTVRLTSATESVSFRLSGHSAAEMWLISAAVPEARDTNPNRLVHSEVLFEYLVGANAVLAECDEATGREVPATEIPFRRPTNASLSGTVGATFPPMTEFCYIADILLGGSSGK